VVLHHQLLAQGGVVLLELEDLRGSGIGKVIGSTRTREPLLELGLQVVIAPADLVGCGLATRPTRPP
jgi:hypothetical protein